MPAKRVKAKGIDDLEKQLAAVDGKTEVYILFCGSKDADGKSWCPDCVKAEPFVEKAIEKLSDKQVFVYCDVGQRDEWKNSQNPFRKNEQFRLTAVPTLLKWKTPKRLVEDQCCSASMLELMFEDD